MKSPSSYKFSSLLCQIWQAS